jgi:ribose transport system permease protein
VFVGLLGGRVAGVPTSFVVALAIVIVLGAAFWWLRFGRDLYALGSGERAAGVSGVDVLKTRTIAFGLSGGCSALCGLFLVSITMFSSPTLAGNMLLLSVVGAVIGGTAISGGVGGLVNAVIGALIVGWLRMAIVLLGLSPQTQNLVFGVATLLAVGLTTDRARLGVVK